MADKTIGALTATAAVVLTDKCEKEPTAGPPSQYFLISQLVTLLNTIYAPITGGAYVLKAGDTMTGLLTIAQATANTSNLILSGQSLTGANAQSLLSMAGTWNTSGNPTALSVAITNTASGATAKLLDLLAGAGGATSMFSVNKDGSFKSPTLSFGTVYQGTIQASVTPLYLDTVAGAGLVNLSHNSTASVSLSASMSEGVKTLSTGSFGWSSTVQGDGPLDTALYRDGAADTVAQRRLTNAQTFRWYRTFTNSTNYERGALQTAAGQVILAAETAGTGTDDIDLVLTPAGVGRVTLPGGAQLLKTTAAMTSGAAAALGTLTNAPSAGNAAVWCPIMFNGVQHWFPCWV